MHRIQTILNNPLSLSPELLDVLTGQRPKVLPEKAVNNCPKCGGPNCLGHGGMPLDLRSSPEQIAVNPYLPREQVVSDTGGTPISISNSLSTTRINALLSGSKWNISTITYSFYEDSVWNGSFYGSEKNVREVSDLVKNNVRKILNWLESVIDLDFVEVTETTSQVGQMRYMLSTSPSYAYAYYPGSTSTTSVAGDIFLNPSYQNSSSTNGFEGVPGNHGYMTLIHETLHALGLKHPFEGGTVLPSNEDNTANTVMSYTFVGNSSGTAMAYDVAALQYLYGAKVKSPENTIYQFTDRIDQFSVNGVASVPSNLPTRQTIWDTAGTDTLNLSNLSFNSGGYRLDLTPGGWLSLASAYKTDWFQAGTAIAYDVLLENLINSSSNDTIYANDASNVFGGYTSGRSVGNDVLWNTDNFDALDLSGYSLASVTRTQNGNDLVLGLGTAGSVTVKDYYSSPQLNILYANAAAFTINDVSVVEGNSGITPLTFKVSLSGTRTQSLSVNYAITGGSATAGSDYQHLANGTLTFTPSETQKNLTVQVLGDLSFEADENLFLTLSNPTGNATIVDPEGIGTIIDDDVLPSLTISDVSVNEAAGNATFTVNLSAATANTVTVNYATFDWTAWAGDDYVATTGTLTFAPGQTSKTLSVGILNDTIYEPNPEIFFVNLSNSQLATITDAQAVATITDNEVKPTISISSLSRSEGNSSEIGKTRNFNLTVSLSHASSQTISVNYSTANGTAVAGSDYVNTSDTLTFNAGQTSKTIKIPVYADKVYEDDETFFVNLTNPTNSNVGVSQGLVTILNDDFASSRPLNATSANLFPEGPDTLTSYPSLEEESLGSPASIWPDLLSDQSGELFNVAPTLA